MTVDILILTDSREQRRSQKKYWYSMKCDLNGELKKTEGTGQIDGTYHQATLAALISAMSRLKRPADVCIHTQDRYVQSAITGSLPKWAENGFMAAGGRELANRKEWEEVWRYSKGHRVTAEG